MGFTAGRGALFVLRTLWTALWLPSVAALCWCRPPLSWWLPPAVLWIAGQWWYLPRLCRSLRGSFENHAVRFCVGVWWRREVFVPLGALRNFEVWTPPLHRLFHCRTVVLRFAGGAAWLPLLDEDTARRLTALLEEAE